MTVTVIAVLAVLGVLVGLVFLLFVFQRRLVYFPDRARPRPEEWDAADFAPVEYRTSDGLSLSAWYRPPDRPGGTTVIHFHGNAGHIGHRAPLVRPFVDAGLGVFLAEYRGYGGNPGSPTEGGLYADGRAAVDHVVAQGRSGQRIVLYGESLGSAIAVMIASERLVDAVVLEAPFASIVEIGAAAYPFLPVRRLMLDRYDSLSRIGSISAPLLVLHGELDEIVPASHGRRMLAAAPEPKEGVFVPEGSHNDLAEFGIAERVLDFLDRHGLLTERSGSGAPTLGRLEGR